MNYYQYFPDDQVHNNWLMFTERRVAPYVSVKPRYLQYVCEKCKKIDHDKAFAEGFDDVLKLRVKGDLFGTSEGFLCMNEKVKRIVDSAGFVGLALKTIAGSDWYVLNCTHRVNADQNAYTVTKQFCDRCGRPKAVAGLIRCLNQINVPSRIGTFFSPIFDRGGSRNGDRDLFATEDIVQKFKQEGIRGGMFTRLLTPTEDAEIKAAGDENRAIKWPKVIL